MQVYWGEKDLNPVPLACHPSVLTTKLSVQAKFGSVSSTSGSYYQVIPGNDQNMSPTNQKTAGSKLERTS